MGGRGRKQSSGLAQQFRSQPQGNETYGFFPLDPFLPFRDARLGWTPGGLSAEGPMTPEPFGLRVSRAAADVS